MVSAPPKPKCEFANKSCETPAEKRFLKPRYDKVYHALCDEHYQELLEKE